MSQFGLKIKNYEAAVLKEYNKGIRDYLSYTPAMFSNSLLSDYLKEIGLEVTKGETTRDIICLKFSFGTRSYEENKKKIEKKLKEETDPKQLEILNKTLEKIEDKKDRYQRQSSEDLRTELYRDGVDITYQ